VNRRTGSRPLPTRAIAPVPPNFVRNFVEGGWRRLERVYGCRDDVILTWMEISGGLEAMQDQRRAYQREQTEAARQRYAPSPTVPTAKLAG
jgi:hypothetical protein